MATYNRDALGRFAVVDVKSSATVPGGTSTVIPAHDGLFNDEGVDEFGDPVYTINGTMHDEGVDEFGDAVHSYKPKPLKP